MGKRGPKAKPAKIKRLEGNPGQRPIPEGYLETSGDIKPPDWLEGYALVVWDRIMSAMPDGVYGAADAETLAAYCDACRRVDLATRVIRLEGEVLTIQTKWGWIARRNPWGIVRERAIAELATNGSRLGLDPTSREKIKAPEKKPAGKFGGLIGIDGGRADAG